MSDSILPKERRVEYWTKVFVFIGIVSGGVWGAWLKVGNVATDEELTAHDDSRYAHKQIRDRLEEQLAMTEAVRAQLKELNEVTAILGEMQVSAEAADREPNRNYKAAAATYYRSEYKKLIRRGYTVKQALDEVREAPWPSRTR